MVAGHPAQPTTTLKCIGGHELESDFGCCNFQLVVMPDTLLPLLAR